MEWNRKTIVTIVTVVCAAAALALLVRHFLRSSGPQDPELREVLEKGNRIHVVCVNPSCGHRQDDFRAQSYDTDWPKVCPQCGQKMLHRAVRCPYCKGRTPWRPDDQGKVYCTECGKWLNPSPQGESPATP